MSEAEETEKIARELHAKRCNFYGIVDPTLIASYWENCDQAMYRAKAATKIRVFLSDTEKTG